MMRLSATTMFVEESCQIEPRELRLVRNLSPGRTRVATYGYSLLMRYPALRCLAF
jgi:hypothetical protein